VRAFLRITDPGIRLAIVHMVEKMGRAPARSPDASRRSA
jgi:hypothetical protein